MGRKPKLKHEGKGETSKEEGANGDKGFTKEPFGPGVPFGEVVDNTPKPEGEGGGMLAEPEAPMTPEQKRIAESRELLKLPLEKGQAFFEAPDGYIMVDMETKGRVWYRAGNGGQGMWINPKR